MIAAPSQINGAIARSARYYVRPRQTVPKFWKFQTDRAASLEAVRPQFAFDGLVPPTGKGQDRVCFGWSDGLTAERWASSICSVQSKWLPRMLAGAS